MIKFEVNFSNATQAELDAFYAIPGMQTAIAELQNHNRQYNAQVTIVAINDQVHEVKTMLMDFMREYNMEAGNILPIKPLQFVFLPKLNAMQRGLVDQALEALVTDGTLRETTGQFFLTEAGFVALY